MARIKEPSKDDFRILRACTGAAARAIDEQMAKHIAGLKAADAVTPAVVPTVPESIGATPSLTTVDKPTRVTKPRADAQGEN